MRHITPYEAQVWARRQRLGGDTAAKVILLLLSDRADEWASCFPGVDLLAAEGELSKSTVLRKLKVLAAAGLIRVERRANERGHRTSNRYVMDLDVVVTAEQWEAAKAEVAAEHPSTTTVQGVNVTPGSPAPPKCQNGGAQVSPDDTVTTRELPEDGPSTPIIAAEAPSVASPGLFDASPASRTSVDLLSPEGAFEAFFEQYPRRVKKAGARRAWNAAMRRATIAEVMAGLGNAKARWAIDRTEEQFIPYPERWLREERWADDYGLTRPGASAAPDPWANLKTPSQIAQGWA